MFKEAVRDYSSALELNPSHFKSLFNRAFCFEKLDALDSSLIDYNQVLELQPGHQSALVSRASIHSRMNRPKAALLDISAAMQNGEKTSALCSARAKLYEKLGHTAEALEDYNVAIELDPADLQNFIGRGNCLRNLEKFVEAAYEYTKGFCYTITIFFI